MIMRLCLLLCLVSFFTPALAFQNDKKLADQKNEAAAQRVFEQIRCLVCKGESLAESNADLAVDMRSLIRDKISKGGSEDEIKDYLVFRYGQGILQSPPFALETYLLWLMPALLLIIGAIGILYMIFAKKIWPQKSST